MKGNSYIQGFSKLEMEGKLSILSQLSGDKKQLIADIKSHEHPMGDIQGIYQGFSENTLTNHFLPWGIAPNFLINNKVYHVPMVTEESSVVAAASLAAKNWYKRGGFHCSVKSLVKTGQVHFEWKGPTKKLFKFFSDIKAELLADILPIEADMIKRGGGISQVEILHLPEVLDNYYQLDVSFNTVESMGANYINTCLEALAKSFKSKIEKADYFTENEKSCEIVMSIVSNYTPQCIVECRVREKVSRMVDNKHGLSGEEFVRKFMKAITIAQKDVKRAVTHNKGIFNGVDAVVLATGNDFRAVEANGHAYASRTGTYRSLSSAWLEGDTFIFSLEIPLAIGTVGGITKLHPMVKNTMDILGYPTADELMQIIASVGLACNYGAVKALITKGIQFGHMKLHLSNILNQLAVNEIDKLNAFDFFKDKQVSSHAVKLYMASLRKERGGE